MPYYKDLRKYLQTLEKSGKLMRVKTQINKDTELHPLVRLQFRGLPEEERKAFLFENIIDSRGRKFSMPVALAAMAGSSEIYALGMKCQPDEISEKLSQAEMNPIPPRLAAEGPVQEEVHLGDRLTEHGGLDEFPIPISTPGYDPAPFVTAGCWVTKDPDSGIRNVGVYRAQLKSPTRTGVCFGDATRHIFQHWQKCKEKGIPLEAAIVVGGPPSVCYTAVAKFPPGTDEFMVSGGIAGEPLELVKCKTVDLEVPAQAEVVIEGEITTKELEPEAPFGEAVGYVGMTEMMPYFTVKCITHRKNPVWLALLSQFPPSESSKLRQQANQGAVYKYLKHDLKMEHVLAVAFHEAATSNVLIVIQMKKTDQAEVWRTLEAAGKRFPSGKTTVAVDEDINPWDADAVNWAIGLRSQPHRDTRIVEYAAGWFADLSLLPMDELLHKRQPDRAEKMAASRMLINATLKWPYPPVSLPKKQYMEAALRLWQKEGFPQLKLKQPWWGYELGYWGNEYDECANLAVKGEYYKTGDIRAQKRVKI